MLTALCAANDVRTQAPIAAGLTSRLDTMIPQYIDTITAQIREFCNRKFDLADYVQYSMSPNTFEYPDPYKIKLRESPITADTVFIDYDHRGQFIDNVSNIVGLVENTDFIVDYDSGVVTIISHSLGYHSRGLKVSYNGGYAASGNVLTVPNDLKSACILQCLFILERIAASQTGQTSEKANRGGNSHVFSTDAYTGLTGEVIGMIKSYKIAMIGSR